jgi:hypothetical protein
MMFIHNKLPTILFEFASFICFHFNPSMTSTLIIQAFDSSHFELIGYFFLNKIISLMVNYKYYMRLFFTTKIKKL